MKITTTPDNNFSNYLIVLFTFGAISPFFALASFGYNLIFLIVAFSIAVKRGVRLIDQKIGLLLIFVYSLIAFQCIYYQGFSPAALYKPLFLVYIPFLIYSLMGISYFKYFNKVLFIIAIYTTPLWLLQSLVPAFDHLLRGLSDIVFPVGWDRMPRSLLIYTSAWGDSLFNESLGIYRNTGLFHEPGAYGIILNIGIVTNSLLTGKFWNKKNIFFIFCVLTTLSTAGYIALFITLTAMLYSYRINFFLKILFISIFMFIALQVYTQEEFLKSKVETQYADQTYAAKENYGKDRPQSGRFYAFITASREFLENPFFGRGIIEKTSKKATGEMHESAAYGYGFMGVFMIFGFPFGIYYMICMYRGFRRIGNISRQKNLFVVATFIAINLALLSQVFVMITIVFILVIIGLYSGKKTYQKPELIQYYKPKVNCSVKLL